MYIGWVGVDQWERLSRKQEGPDARNKKLHQTNTQMKIAAKGRVGGEI